MRDWIGLVLLLALVGSPVRASAEVAGEREKTERPVLKLDESGLEMAPSVSALEDMERRLRAPRAGLAVSSIVLGGGAAMMVVGFLNFEDAGICVYGDCGRTPTWTVAVAVSGALLTIGGLVGIIVSGNRLAERKRELYELKNARSGTPRRAQWDLARSRLAF